MYGLLHKILLLDSIPDRAVELFASYIGPAVFLVVGALLTIVGLLVQEEKPAPPAPPKGYRPKPVQAAQRVNLLDTMHDAKVPRWLRYGLIFMGLALLLAGILWVVVLFTRTPGVGLVATATPTITVTPSNIPTVTATFATIPTMTPTYANIPSATATYASFSTPTETHSDPITTPTPEPQFPGLAGIALSSLKYQAGGWDPRQVDLRHAAIDGVEVNAGDSLVLYDLWVAVPENTVGLKANMELYASGEIIGRTGEVDLHSGGVLFEAIKPLKYTYAGVDNGFKIQEDWELLDVVLAIRSGSRELQNVVTPIVLNKTGKAWYITPPYAHLVSMVYSTNDHAKQVMDLSAVLQNGLAVSGGDKLAIHEIWYKTEATLSDQSLHVEAYPSSGIYDTSQVRTNSWNTFREGINNLLPEKDPFVWENISQDQKWLVVALTRNDQTVLDRYVIPIKPGAEPGLVPANQAILWPFERFTYIDFESPVDVDSWWPLGRNGIEQSNAQAFSGNSSLAVTIRSNTEQGWLEWDRAFTAEYVLGQVYWPARSGISISWAQVCEPTSGGCVSIPTRMNEWNTFVIQFSQWKFKDKTMNQIEVPYLYFQGSISGIGDVPYIFFMDGIQLYRSLP